MEAIPSWVSDVLLFPVHIYFERAGKARYEHVRRGKKKADIIDLVTSSVQPCMNGPVFGSHRMVARGRLGFPKVSPPLASDFSPSLPGIWHVFPWPLFLYPSASDSPLPCWYRPRKNVWREYGINKLFQQLGSLSPGRERNCTQQVTTSSMQFTQQPL